MAEKNELGKKPEKKTTNRGITWPDAATIALLNIWNEEEIRLSLENTKSSRETRAIYRTITIQMHKKGFEKFTVDNIVNKMKKLRQRFKKEVDNKRKTGTGKPKTTWKFFKNVDEIIGHRPNVCPVFCIDTSAVEKQEDTEVKNDKVIESIKKKYGAGKIFNEVCQKCGYEAEGLYSAGVHDSESGCIKVYTDDDEFVCPICTIAEMSDQEDKDIEEVESIATSQSIPAEDNDIEEVQSTASSQSKPADSCKKKENNSAKKKKPVKPKKKTSFEKGLDVMCQKFDSESQNEMEWFMKLDEARHKREIEFQLKQTQIENERRQQEREHELNMFSLLMENKSTSNNRSFQGMLPLSMAASSSSLSQHFSPMPWDQNSTLYPSTSSNSSLHSDDNAKYTSL